MSIEAMKLALEALDCLIYDKPHAGRFADALIGLRTAIQQAEAQQPATGEPVKAERDQLRCAQADAVMPLIGPLLDAWENADREVISQEPELSRQLKAINNAMEDAQPATGEPDEWKLVPIVPTEKMLLAYTGGAVTNAGFRWCRHQWSAMLAAAPAAHQDLS